MMLPTIEDLACSAADIAQTRGELEANFVAIGGSLVQSVQLFNRITGQFESLPHDLASPELTEATTRLTAVGRQAREMSASFAVEQQGIARLAIVVEAARAPIASLSRAVKMMGILAINARVAAAALGDGNDLGVFTVDITGLSNEAAATIREFSATFEQLSGVVLGAAEKHAAFEAVHSRSLDDLAARLDAHLDDLVVRRQSSADSSEQTGEMSRQIAQRVSSAVMAMQVGDATRQRLEHVEAALARLGTVLVSSDPVSPSFGALLSLQSALLAGAGADFLKEVDTANAALRQLIEDTRTAIRQSRALYGSADDNSESSLAGFSAEMAKAVVIRRECETERHELELVAHAVLDTVTVLVRHVDAVRAIEGNMRLVSLNAAIRCAQLGPRGRALNVIASQLRELTVDTVLSADAAMRELATAVELARQFDAASAGAATDNVAWLETEASQALTSLTAVDHRLGEALGVLDSSGKDIVAHLEVAATSLAGHTATSAAIARTSHQLADYAWDGPLDPMVIDLAAELHQGYTMGQERQIHDSAFPARAIAA